MTKRKVWNFNEAISGSFAELRWTVAMWKAATLAEVAVAPYVYNELITGSDVDVRHLHPGDESVHADPH